MVLMSRYMAPNAPLDLKITPELVPIWKKPIQQFQNVRLRLSTIARHCPHLRHLFELTPGGVRPRGQSDDLRLKVEVIARHSASIARTFGDGKTSSVALPATGCQKRFG